MIQNVQNMQKLSKLIPKSSNFHFSATNHWVLPGSVGHPPESHHGQGDHLSWGLFVSGVDVVLNFHWVFSGHHCQGSIDSSKIMNPFLQSSYATGGTVWIVPSSNKIFQWSRAFLTTAAPICYNHAYISKQQLFCSKSASLPIALKKSKKQPGCIRTKPGKIQVHLHLKAQAMQGPQAQGGPSLWQHQVPIPIGKMTFPSNLRRYTRNRKSATNIITHISLHRGYESSTASLRTFATLDTNH